MSTQPMVNVTPKSVYEMLQNGRFLIPLYQRDYAWGRDEITQLLSDLSQAGDRTYYLGTLVVMQRGEMLEVVDGQQRLTTLTLLYKQLGLLEKNPLNFENRPAAMRALVQVFDNKEPEEENFWRAVDIIKKSPDLKSKDDVIKTCLQGKLMLFQVTLPTYTDVAAYFEVMNNRGRQLEAPEILKAKLMAEIKEEDDKTRKEKQEDFAKRWENCKGEDLVAPGETLTNRLVKKDEVYVSESPAEDEGRTLLTFPRLLLIALRCHLKDQDGKISLNDRNLVTTFNENKVEPMEFIKTLEKVREDFDSHVIRSVVTKDADNERWSLKSVEYKMLKEDKAIKETPVLKDTYGEDNGKRIIQLQSLLQVSGISWIPDFLFERRQKKEKKESLDDVTILETFIREKLADLKNYAGSEEPPAALSYGSRPLLALNVLDYLFWQKAEEGDLKNGDPKDKDFVFRYRNSIEHFYPQDDKLCKGEEWIGGEKNLFLNCIGNLYLTTGKENSKLSNYSPSAKIDLWDDKSSPMTPKQRRMYDVARKEKEGGKKCWTAKDCEDHAKVCWRMLAEFLGVPLPRDSPSTPAAIKDDPDTPSTGEGGNVGGGETASAENGQPAN